MFVKLGLLTDCWTAAALSVVPVWWTFHTNPDVLQNLVFLLVLSCRSSGNEAGADIPVHICEMYILKQKNIIELNYYSQSLMIYFPETLFFHLVCCFKKYNALILRYIKKIIQEGCDTQTMSYIENVFRLYLGN